MRFLYIAPRYHTNQAPVMKYLTQNGHKVCFISHYRGKIEDYSVVQPVILGYAKLFYIWEKFYVSILNRNNSKAVDMKLKLGFPPVRKLRKEVKKFAPDVMIIRERSVYSIITCLACRGMHIPMILYNQSPLWEETIKNDPAHKIVRALLPKVRMTPVKGTEDRDCVKEEGAVFIPFVIEPRERARDKQWFQKENVNILCIGKYEKRKNIRMLLEVFEELHVKYALSLTIAGECSSRFHREYRAQQETFVKEHDLQGEVTLLQNLGRQEIEELYRKTDLFVLPSTDEPASVSQLEAMAFSVPVICSDRNGTACYVESGVNGYLFQDNQKKSLKEEMERMVADRGKMTQMGENGYEYIKDNCSFSRYYDGILQCMDRIKKQE